ncbi:MAG: bifunctional diaminohydroxyphosphoribosylaminopyrimidine deaminase/5-amino-6-(5-phosphoribosylamino)uracil reductase RibD [Synergistaceae bacterium]|nr:bifunctional diaminohydroxyphosphoribosylaminopyrimidine deaminase/5-amino-6-(5-phosphoribosylamino)uracil reductase RibD [Synergistaceae bacterium]
MHGTYMRRALSLAPLGMGRTSPNPMVGCVIVKDGRIIGEGWHQKHGSPHAEIEALNDAKTHSEDVRGSTVYVTLEPCSHYGKTPPCANRLVSEGVSEVIVAMRDPNPKVNGKGIEILREAGIKVTELHREFEEAAKFLNRGFVSVHTRGRPFVTLKAAMSLDGRLCLSNGSSKWITGILSRTEAHRIRSENDAVLVGVNTVLRDDPELTVRHVKGINPLRVILDAGLSTPAAAKVIGHDGKCLILTSEGAPRRNEEALRASGANVSRLPCNDGRIDLHEVLKCLAGMGVLTLMVEGGPAVLSAFIREGLADYGAFFISPRILGEGQAITLGLNFPEVRDAFRLEGVRSKILGDDIMTEGRIIRECSQDL